MVSKHVPLYCHLLIYLRNNDLEMVKSILIWKAFTNSASRVLMIEYQQACITYEISISRLCE